MVLEKLFYGNIRTSDFRAYTHKLACGYVHMDARRRYQITMFFSEIYFFYKIN